MARALKAVARWLRGAKTGRWIASHIGASYIRLAMGLTRWRVIGMEHRDDVLARGGGLIASIWHGRLFASATFAPPGRRVIAMISNNRDGDLISAIVARFGVFSVRGSTYDHAKQRDKGGRAVFRDAFEELTKRASVVAITPDGPRGPRMRAQSGIAALSVEARVPVLPVAFSVFRGKTMRSWDRFLVPWPFGAGVVIYGAAIEPPENPDDAELEAYRLLIERKTTEITLEADRLCGRDPMVAEPEPLAS